MEASNKSSSYEASWADQWDYASSEPLPPAQDKKSRSSGGGGGGKYKQKMEEGLHKTKAVASVGFNKVKQGTTVGFHWIKEKYQKTTQKH